jgi:hypothetical protein
MAAKKKKKKAGALRGGTNINTAKLLKQVSNPAADVTPPRRRMGPRRRRQ